LETLYPREHCIQARKQKDREDDVVVLHQMLAEMLRRHRKECSAANARRGKGPVRNTDRVFHVSSSLLRWLKLDAEWAGIGLFDARGRSTTIHGIRAGFATTLRRNATDPALRVRLMRQKTADLTMGTYDKVEDTELRRELERLPVANALRLAAGAECVSVPVQVNQGPNGADRGRSTVRGVKKWALQDSNLRSPSHNRLTAQWLRTTTPTTKVRVPVRHRPDQFRALLTRQHGQPARPATRPLQRPWLGPQARVGTRRSNAATPPPRP